MSRIGTAYQKSVATQTGDYTILHGDDFIPFNIAGAQTATLPSAGGCNGDDGEKVVANLGTSGGALALVAPAGDTLTGASSLTAGQAVHVFKAGPNAWSAEAPFSAEGLTTGTISTADSKGVSAGTRASVADSKAVSDGTGASTADSKALSVSTLTSTADSKAVSDGLAASGATSAATSNSVVISSLTSRVSSKGG